MYFIYKNMCQFFYLNNNLSIVVRTQKSLCNIIPSNNKIPNTIKNEYFIKYDIKKANIIDNIKSNIAILNILYECNPSFGLPNIFLYLHKFIIYISFRYLYKYFTEC